MCIIRCIEAYTRARTVIVLFFLKTLKAPIFVGLHDGDVHDTRARIEDIDYKGGGMGDQTRQNGSNTRNFKLKK